MASALVKFGQGCSSWGVRYDRIPHVTWHLLGDRTRSAFKHFKHSRASKASRAWSFCFMTISGRRSSQTWKDGFAGRNWPCWDLRRVTSQEILHLWAFWVISISFRSFWSSTFFNFLQLIQVEWVESEPKARLAAQCPSCGLRWRTDEPPWNES